MALRNGMRSIVIIYVTCNNNNNNNNNNIMIIIIQLLTAIELSPGGSSPYSSAGKTNNNTNIMLIREQKLYILAQNYTKLQTPWHKL
jgi:uncharacterized protein involved in tolerance to divalent cations